ncbi:MAG: transcriptional regulator [Phycisphaeraceae bacterium]|nr:transcriptional regulator [Phycisphaeraceae bacterium]
MKLIIAYIQPEKLNDVKQKLRDKSITKMSVTNALGCGQQQGYEEHYRGTVVEVNLLKKVRLEIGVTDEFVDTTVSTIVDAARSGSIGDGKIFVVPLEQCVRIRTGQTGDAAIG